MSNGISILLVGIGGFAQQYVKELLEYKGIKQFKIVGVVDPNPENCSMLSQMKDREIPVYNSMNDFYYNRRADLAIISSPIHYHCRQAVYAMEKGSNVLCEKPICATAQDAYRMITTRDKTGKKLAIGYQWSYSNAVLNLKQDIIKGVLGRPKRLKTIVLWPRTYAYYERNNWAGKIKDDKGNWILDSVANNATSHFLHNMFFITGSKIDTSTVPVKVTGEIYKANDIENYDTIALRVITEDELEILYYAAHPVKEQEGPNLVFEFEDAIVTMEKGINNDFIAKFKDGRTKSYGNPNINPMKKLWTMIDLINGDNVILPCPPEAAMPQLLVINGIQQSNKKAVQFPKSLIKEDELIKGHKGKSVEGLASELKKCYEKNRLPNECDIPWSKPGGEFNFVNYKFFDM